MKVAIVFPGGGYTALGPALRIPVLAAMQRGYEPMNVEYPREALAVADVDAIVDSARSQVAGFVEGARDVLLIPKSFGTRVVGALTGIVDPVESVSAIFVTPMFQREAVRDAITEAGWRSMFAVGGADDVCDPEADALMAAALDATVFRIDGADHGLEIAGDLAATTAGFDQLGRAALAFVESL